MPRAKKAVVKEKPRVVEVEYNLNTLEGACDYYGVEYRAGATRLIDLAKHLGVYYQDGYTIEQILEQASKKK